VVSDAGASEEVSPRSLWDAQRWAGGGRRHPPRACAARPVHWSADLEERGSTTAPADPAVGKAQLAKDAADLAILGRIGRGVWNCSPARSMHMTSGSRWGGTYGEFVGVPHRATSAAKTERSASRGHESGL
jgi:hypothetical protein